MTAQHPAQDRSQHPSQRVLRIDGRRFLAEDFHDIFSEVFGFPVSYGRNMDDWIDCMTSLDAPADGLSTVTVPTGGILVLQIDHFELLKHHRPDVVDVIVECSAFVNWRRRAQSNPAVIALSFGD